MSHTHKQKATHDNVCFLRSNQFILIIIDTEIYVNHNKHESNSLFHSMTFSRVFMNKLLFLSRNLLTVQSSFEEKHPIPKRIAEKSAMQWSYIYLDANCFELEESNYVNTSTSAGAKFAVQKNSKSGVDNKEHEIAYGYIIWLRS